MIKDWPQVKTKKEGNKNNQEQSVVKTMDLLDFEFIDKKIARKLDSIVLRRNKIEIANENKTDFFFIHILL